MGECFNIVNVLKQDQVTNFLFFVSSRSSYDADDVIGRKPNDLAHTIA